MDEKMRQEIALHRWAVIAEAANPRLSGGERGAVVRAIAARQHAHPDGTVRRYSRGTVDRWLRAWRAGGVDGLRPAARSDTGKVRAMPELFAEAAALRLELPGRSAAQISSILYHRHGVRVAERTVRGQLRRAGLHRAALKAAPKAYGRYEAERPNERWVTDVLVGPWVPYPKRDGSARARLFLIVDDHSRLLVDGRFYDRENARICQELLRRAITRRGIPDILYADNGAPFANAWLARTCAVLGIRLIHSKPYSPQGRGKQERANRYIREAFLAEAMHQGIESLDQLNDWFAAWAEQVANRRVHAETGQPPIDRFQAAGPHRQADPALIREAFRWSVTRRVTRVATVPLEGNSTPSIPPSPGRRVELRYDPEDLAGIEVFLDGRPAGAAVPFVIGRHVHRAVAPPAPPAADPTGIDYLGMVAAAHDEEAGTGAAIDFTRLPMLPQRPGRTAMASRAPWAAHFGLARTPFGKAIAAGDLFARQAHAQATARISFCITETLLGVITGDVGAGKTVAVRAAVAGLDPTRHQVIYVANPAFGTRGLYVQVVRALGAQPRYLKAELMAQAADLLAAEAAERHRTVVLIVDEAHLLQPDQLEELRLMTNAEMDSASPFAGILIGQPTLARQLRMGTFAALDQRIATRYAIKPMDLAESAAYLRHHMTLAGREEPLFADDAVARLHRVSSGLPRALNNAATAALIAAAAAGQDLVDDACAKKAVAELTRD